MSKSRSELKRKSVKNKKSEIPPVKKPTTAKASDKGVTAVNTNKLSLNKDLSKEAASLKDAFFMAGLPDKLKVSKIADLSAMFRASVANVKVAASEVNTPRSKEDILRTNYSGLATGVTNMSPSTNMISFGAIDDERWWDSKTLVEKPEDFVFDATVMTTDETKLVISRAWSVARNSKTFYVKNMNGSVQSLDDVDKSKIHLFFIDEAIENTRSPIILCEGYRAAMHLRSLNFNAVGTIDGGTLPVIEVLQRLKGRKVLLWPDNDDIGLKHMSRIFERLQALGVDADHIIRWKDGPKNGDAADISKVKDIKKLIDEAEAWPPALLVRVTQPAQIKRVGHQLKLRANSIIARGGR